MVRTGNPDYVVPRHALKANENILQRIIQCMTHVQLPCNIRRRHNNTIRLTRRIGILMKVPFFLPKIVPFRFNFSGIIPFEFFLVPLHMYSSFYTKNALSSQVKTWDERAYLPRYHPIWHKARLIPLNGRYRRRLLASDRISRVHSL